MVERQLLASPYRSPGPASLRHKSSIGRQGIYSPIRTPSPQQPHPHHRNISESFRRPATPIRPALYRHDQHIQYSLLPDTPEHTPPSRPGSSGYGSHLTTTPPLRAVRSPSPLLFSSPATPASTPGPHASRKDRRTTVRVAHISDCNCTQFKHQIVTREPQISGLHPGQPLLQWAKRPIQKHVAVSWTKVQINEVNGTAISYTWGDFERENMIIGHWEEDPTRAISMNLGTEWDVEDLLDRLVEISAAKGSVWIDQLCAPQREDYANEILPKIPDIFRSMEVVVLMPGARCECLERAMDKVKKSGRPGDVAEKWLEKWLEGPCHNKAGLSSYTNRMWARQEFRYAQNLRLVWNRKTPAQCFQYEDVISGKADISAISGYATALFMQKLHEGFDLADKNGYWMIKDATDKFARDLRKECDTLKTEKKGLPVFFRMLLGMPLERVKDADENPIFELTHSLRTFCRNLRGLAYGTHMATNTKDLVLSVWVDLPGYKMPQDLRFFSTVGLLDDAVRKLEAKHHVTLSTHAPAGLFKESPGGCWRPEIFLANKQIKEVRDLYSTLSEADAPLYMRDGQVPLQISTNHAIGRRSFVYRDIYKEATLAKVGPILTKVVKNFDDISQSRLGALWHEYQEREAAVLAPRKIAHKKKLNGESEKAGETENLFEFLAEYYFFDNICNQNLDEDTQTPWDTLQEVDHYKIMYKLTCYLLGLDHEFCKQKGLELVIAPDEPAVIGLTNRVTVPSWLSRFDKETLTISTSVNRQRKEEMPMCMLELRKNGQLSAKGGEPEYVVTGSWVSCQKVGEKDLGGIAIPRDVHSVKVDGLRTDGWLV